MNNQEFIRMESIKEKNLEEIFKKIKSWTIGFKKSHFFENLPIAEDINVEIIIDFFASFAYGIKVENPNEWTVETLRICCMETFPQVVAEEDSFFEDVPYVLSAFFLFLEEQGHIQNGQELSDAVTEMDVVSEARNKDNWDLSKVYTMYVENRIDYLTDNPLHLNADIRVIQERINELMVLTYVFEQVNREMRNAEEVVDELPSSEYIYLLFAFLSDEDMIEFADKEVVDETHTYLIEETKKGRYLQDIMAGFSPAQELIAFFALKMSMENHGEDFDTLVSLRLDEATPKHRTRKVLNLSMEDTTNTQKRRNKRERKSSRKARILPMYLEKTPKVSRNAPCPCGSGKKYKRCCGK